MNRSFKWNIAMIQKSKRCKHRNLLLRLVELNEIGKYNLITVNLTRIRNRYFGVQRSWVSFLISSQFRDEKKLFLGTKKKSQFRDEKKSHSRDEIKECQSCVKYEPLLIAGTGQTADVQLSERLASLGIMGHQLRVPWNPLLSQHSIVLRSLKQKSPETLLYRIEGFKTTIP